MLQKLKKCEVKAHSVEIQEVLLIVTQFYVKSILAKFESQKLPSFTVEETLNFEFCTFWDLKIAICKSQNVQSTFRTTRINKNDNFWPFEFAKI